MAKPSQAGTQTSFNAMSWEETLGTSAFFELMFAWVPAVFPLAFRERRGNDGALEHVVGMTSF
jgi:hypothetical protein